MLRSLENLNVLVVGDAIVDEYHYVEPLGQSSKGMNLSVKFSSQEQFAGGSSAIANHIAGFVKDVTVVGGLGEQESHEEFLRSKLKQGFGYKTPEITNFHDFQMNVSPSSGGVMQRVIAFLDVSDRDLFIKYIVNFPKNIFHKNIMK